MVFRDPESRRADQRLPVSPVSVLRAVVPAFFRSARSGSAKPARPVAHHHAGTHRSAAGKPRPQPGVVADHLDDAGAAHSPGSGDRVHYLGSRCSDRRHRRPYRFPVHSHALCAEAGAPVSWFDPTEPSADADLARRVSGAGAESVLLRVSVVRDQTRSGRVSDSGDPDRAGGGMLRAMPVRAGDLESSAVSDAIASSRSAVGRFSCGRRAWRSCWSRSC